MKQLCEREYGLSDGEKLRAADLSMLSASDLEGLPTSNLATKRNFHNLIEKPK